MWDNQPLLVLIILGIFGTIGALIIGSVTLNHASKDLEEDFAKDVGEILTKHAFEGRYLQQPDNDFLAIRQLSDLGGIKFPGSGKRRYGNSGTWNETDFRLIRVMFATSNNSTQRQSFLVMNTIQSILMASSYDWMCLIRCQLLSFAIRKRF